MSTIPYVIGIGASAGGLDALERLFENMPEGTGASFVVIQHLSPHFRSFMPELLAKRTNIKITRIIDGLAMEPDHIYLIPPIHHLHIENGCFRLTEYRSNERLHLPINVFFESLALEYQQKAIGIILSGTGSDGTQGIQAIHRFKGLVIAQDQVSAEFSGMPMSAVSTGIVNYVRTPEGIVEELMKHMKDPSVTEEETLQRIFEFIRQQVGVDFSGYKKAGMVRRIERRMKLNHLESLSQYLEHLTQTPEEVSLLHKDMLIGVTHFFRDPEAFHVIYEKVIPEIVSFKEGKKDEIRIWVAGCSTGEEAYTLAMLLRQYQREHDLDLGVRIFATDLDKEAIQYASQGVYPLSAADQLPKEYVEKFFVQKEDAYQIHKDIRSMIVFAPHNIIKDPPFVNLDLVTCRNMMIYFQPEIQRKVLSLFHFSLRSDGFLFLGPSESLGKSDHLYTLVNRKWNIFKNHETYLPALSSSLSSTHEVKDKTSSDSTEPLPMKEFHRQTKLDDIALTLLEQYLSPCVIIDYQNNVVYTGGDLGSFVQFPKGRASFNILKMVSTPISVAINTGIHKIRKNKEKHVSFTVNTNQRTDGSSTRIIVEPFSEKKYSLGLIIIRFENVPAIPETQIISEQVDIQNNANIRIQELERELLYAQESLQATIEELETSNEELQSTNEELIASNEEFQSANEELQSVNEELMTVNSEHQRKIQELVELNNDMDNLLNSTKIATIFLDNNMCIRRFTPSVTSLINVLDIDIGRPFHHLSHNLKYDGLLQDVRQVISTVTTVHREILSQDGFWYSMSILPYRTMDNRIEGAVITFVDITELKQVNKELQKLSYAVHQSPSIITILDRDGMIEYVNQAFVEKTGYEFREIINQNFLALYSKDPGFNMKHEEIFKLLNTGKTWNGELKYKTKDGQVYWEYASFLPIIDEQGEIVHFLKASEDITDKKNTEDLLRKSKMLSAVGELAAGIAHEIRNPLTSLKGFIQLMKSDGDGNPHYLKIILSEFDRIELIINELLLLSKPHALSFKSADTLQILNHVTMLIETQALMNNVTVKLNIEESLSEIICVENQIKQVLINVLKNAIEAMPNGGNIFVTAKTDGHDTLLIRISDDGPGIPEKILSRIGEPFYTTKENGTGLGLMISYKIIENHNGRMLVMSKEGKGTTVDIYLPTHMPTV